MRLLWKARLRNLAFCIIRSSFGFATNPFGFVTKFFRFLIKQKALNSKTCIFYDKKKSIKSSIGFKPYAI